MVDKEMRTLFNSPLLKIFRIRPFLASNIDIFENYDKVSMCVCFLLVYFLVNYTFFYHIQKFDLPTTETIYLILFLVKI